MSEWTSNAQWPLDVYRGMDGKGISTDTHRTREEAQAWFSPLMPPKPTSDWVSDDGSTHYFTWQDAQRECGDCYYDANSDAIAQWEAKYSKQWCVQWPYAWADEQLKARKEPGQ